MDDHVLYVGTYGPEDETRVTLVFAAAIRMKERQPGVAVKVALLGEGIHLIDEKKAGAMRVSGSRQYRSIREMIEAARKAGVEIHC